MSELNNILDRIKSSDKLELQLVTGALDTILSGLSKIDLLKKHNEILQDIADGKFKYEGNSEDIEIVFSQRINDYKESEQEEIDDNYSEKNSKDVTSDSEIVKETDNEKKEEKKEIKEDQKTEEVKEVSPVVGGIVNNKEVKKETQKVEKNTKIKAEEPTQENNNIITAKKKEIKTSDRKETYIYASDKLIGAEFIGPFDTIQQQPKEKENKENKEKENKEKENNNIIIKNNIPNISDIHKQINHLKGLIAAPIKLPHTSSIYILDDNGDYIDAGYYDENKKRKSNSLYGAQAVINSKHDLPKAQKIFNSLKKELEGLESGIIPKIEKLSKKVGGLGVLEKLFKDEYTHADREIPSYFKNHLSIWLKTIILNNKLDRINEIIDIELNK